MKSINPFNGKTIASYATHRPEELPGIVESVHQAWLTWKNTEFPERAVAMKKAATILRQRKEELATLMTLEMGNLIRESMAEIEKCAWVCDFYADNAA